jgi:glycosyltransferase involved in cell wall biosynthesis
MAGNILIFSEEYIKITKGMFVVWVNHVLEVSKRNHVDILLNHEHWAFGEVKEAFQDNKQVTVHNLPFNMPSTLLKRVLTSGNSVCLFRAVIFVLGRILNFALSPLIIFYLIVRLRQIQPSAVFSHNGGWPAGQLCRWIIYAAVLARVTRRIIIIHSHPAKSTSFFWGVLFLPLRFMQARLMDKCATSIVTVSDSVKVALESNVFKSPISRIYNGIQMTQTMHGSQVCCPTLDWHPSALCVGFVGALYFHKGPHVLLDAFRLVTVPCELALLGPPDPHYLQILKQKAQLCANKVSFLGFHQNVDSFMQKIDLLVVPSVAFESFGMVILEAMKQKKSVICSDFGGMKEVVEHGVTGLVVAAGDELALAKAITKLLVDADLRLRMGDAGYWRLNELFTSEKMTAQYYELLD